MIINDMDMTSFKLMIINDMDESLSGFLSDPRDDKFH
jgi:hypothetical protein